MIICLAIHGVELGAFSVEDAKRIRELADRLSLSSDLQQEFLTKSKNIVSLFSGATPSQRDDVITVLEDGRFSGTMPSIQKELDSLLITARATPAGLSESSTNQPSSAGAVQAQGVASFVDRIAGLKSVIDAYLFKTITESDRTQVMALIQGLFDDRAGSFGDERQRLIVVINTAKMRIFRDDATRRGQIDSLISQLSSQVPFDAQLAFQKRLYALLTPLTTDQKARLLRHFQEMVLMVPSVTDIVLNNDFRELLEYCDATFFQEDPNAHSIIMGLLSKVPRLDSIFAQPFGDIITSLRASAPSISSAGLKGFVDNVQTLVSMRYGNKTADLANKNINAVALQDFLNYLIALPPFSSYVVQLTMWLSMVRADNNGPVTVKFIDKVNRYLSVEFMQQTSDQAKRGAFMADLAELMGSRYGQLQEEKTAEAIAFAKQKLKQLLSWIRDISWFRENLTVINSYIAQIDADPATNIVVGSGATSTVTSPTAVQGNGTFSVSFGADIPTQVRQLEQSLSGAVNDNQKEMFMLALFDVIERKTAATPDDLTRIGALIATARNSANLGAAFGSYFTFLQGGLTGSFSEDLRMDVYRETVARIAGMTIVAENVQEKILEMVQYLVENHTKMSSNQVQQVGANISAIIVKATFSSGRITDLTDMYTELSMRISGGAATGLPANSSSNSSAPTNPNASSQVLQQEQEQIRLHFQALHKR